MKQQNKGWERIPVDKAHKTGENWSRSIDQCWRYTGKRYKEAFQIRFLESKNFSSMTHIIMKRVDKEKGPKGYLDSEELMYEEKVRILRKLGRVGRVALEVFPERCDLVDDANLYHIWEIADEKILPFSTGEIFTGNSLKWDRLEAVDLSAQYATKVVKTPIGRVMYLFLKGDNGELHWWEKQQLKEAATGDVTAVEIVTSSMSNLGYSCLICLPYKYQLDFGLHL